MAASVLATATVAAQVGEAFAELRKDSSELSGRLHTFHNEVADVKFVSHQVAAVLEEHNSSLSDMSKASTPSLLSQADVKLKALKNILDRLKRSYTTRRILPGASAWNECQPKLQALQSDIRALKLSLNMLLGFFRLVCNHVPSRDHMRLTIGK